MNSKKKPAIKPVSTKPKILPAKVAWPPSLPEAHRNDAPGDSIEAGKKSSTRGKTSYSARPAPKHLPIMPDPTKVEYFKDIVATIRDPLVVLDAGLHLLAANHSFYKTFKVKKKETIGNLIYDLGNRQWDIPALRALLETILPQKALFNDYLVEHDFPFIGKRTLLLNARRIPAPPKEAQWILLAFEDVTERMELERSLQASEKQFHAVFETASDSMLLVDKISGQVHNSNRAAQDSLGYSKRTLQKKNLWELGILKDRRQFKRISIELEKQGVVGLVDTTIPTSQGGDYPANITIMDRSEVIQFSIHEITERKQAEEKLGASENELRALFAAMTDVVFILDGDGRYLRIAPTNPINLYRLPEDVLGKTVHEVLPKEQADFMMAKICAAIQTNQTVLGEMPCKLTERKSGLQAAPQGCRKILSSGWHTISASASGRKEPFTIWPASQPKTPTR